MALRAGLVGWGAGAGNASAVVGPETAGSGQPQDELASGADGPWPDALRYRSTSSVTIRASCSGSIVMVDFA